MRFWALPRPASETEIKSAFRRQAMKYHPDRNPGDKQAEEQFKKINEAFSVLSDPQKKHMYDQYGHDGVNAGAGGFNGFNASGFADVGDIFGSVFGDIFGAGFGGSARGGKPRVQRGEDLKVDADLTLEQAYSGLEKEVSYTRVDRCSVCGGTGAEEGSSVKTCRSCNGSGSVVYRQGFFSMRQTCPDCGGKGTVVERPCKKCRGSGVERVRENITVKIPSGVRTGVTLRGEQPAGTLAPTAAVTGIYMWKYTSKTIKFLNAMGTTWLLTRRLPIRRLCWAAASKCPLLKAKKWKSTFPKARSLAKCLKCRAAACPGWAKRALVILLVNVKIEVPKRPTARQKELLEELAKETGGKKSFFEKLFD